MNPVLLICFTELIRQHIIVDEMLGAFGSKLEHDSH